MKFKIPIATVVMLVESQERQSFASIRKVGYVDQYIATGRKTIRNVTSIASVNNLRLYCGRTRTI
jgi:hypothetical protein